MHPQHILGVAIWGLAGVVWIVGGLSVRDRCLRRLGRPKPLNFDLDMSRVFPYQDFDASEWRRLLLILAISLALTFLGLGLVDDVFGWAAA